MSILQRLVPLFVVAGGLAQGQNPAWTWEPHLHLGSRWWHSMTEDAGRQRVVLFGGSFAQAYSNHAFDTWEWDGVRWLEQRPAVSPPPRGGAAMAYDSVRNRVMLFGGTIGSTSPTQVLNDMWEWDGQTWREVLPTGPWSPVRAQHAMASDPVRGKIVLFGGLDPIGPTGHFDDTWEWDGTGWTQMTPSVVPRMRHLHAMAFNSTSGRVMLYGGGFGWLFIWSVDDPWYEWDGTNWTYMPVAPPGPGLWQMASYQNGVLLHDAGVTWQYDGTQWAQLNLPTWPGDRDAKTATASLSSLQQVVHYGGIFGRSNSWSEPVSRVPSPDPLDRLDSTWTFSNGAWRREQIQAEPELEIARVAADPLRDRSVLLVQAHSATPGTYVFETWVHEGDSFRRLPVTAHPPYRSGGMMAYHEGLDRFVLFGGLLGPQRFTDTWVFDGTQWVEDTSPNPISTALHHSLGHIVYNPHRGTLMMNMLFRREVWEWSGAGWSNYTAAELPQVFQGRSYHVFAYDPARDRLIAHGGQLQSVPSLDTWEFDGVQWTQVATVAQPTARDWYPSSATYVPELGGVVAFPRGLPTPWIYDGSTWREVVTERPIWYGNGIAGIALPTYHPRRGIVRLFAPTVTGTTSPGAQVWDLVERSLYASTQQPRLGERLGFRFEVPRLPSSLGVVGISGGLWPGVPIGSGDGRVIPLANDGLLSISLTLGLWTLTDGNGSGSVQLAPIPVVPALLGTRLHAAGAVFDPATGWIGHVTNPVTIRVVP